MKESLRKNPNNYVDSYCRYMTWCWVAALSCSSISWRAWTLVSGTNRALWCTTWISERAKYHWGYCSLYRGIKHQFSWYGIWRSSARNVWTHEPIYLIIWYRWMSRDMRVMWRWFLRDVYSIIFLFLFFYYYEKYHFFDTDSCLSHRMYSLKYIWSNWRSSSVSYRQTRRHVWCFLVFTLCWTEEDVWPINQKNTIFWMCWRIWTSTRLPRETDHELSNMAVWW